MSPGRLHIRGGLIRFGGFIIQLMVGALMFLLVAGAAFGVGSVADKASLPAWMTATLRFGEQSILGVDVLMLLLFYGAESIRFIREIMSESFVGKEGGPSSDN